MDRLPEKSELELLKLWANVIVALRAKNIVRTNNNPLGDFTEWLVCERLGLHMAEYKAEKGYDATDDERNKYQIKGRRTTTSSVTFSPIRGYEGKDFDYLILVVFGDDFQVTWAAKVPHELVREVSRYSKHVGAWLPARTKKVLKTEGVEDLLYKFTS